MTNDVFVTIKSWKRFGEQLAKTRREEHCLDRHDDDDFPWIFLLVDEEEEERLNVEIKFFGEQ